MIDFVIIHFGYYHPIVSENGQRGLNSSCSVATTTAERFTNSTSIKITKLKYIGYYLKSLFI